MTSSISSILIAKTLCCYLLFVICCILYIVLCYMLYVTCYLYHVVHDLLVVMPCIDDVIGLM